MRRGQPDDKREGIQKMVSDGSKLIEDAKQNYFLKAGQLWLILEPVAKPIGH